VRIVPRTARLGLGQGVVVMVDKACCRHQEKSSRYRFRPYNHKSLSRVRFRVNWTLSRHCR
jgi:hypothetical protein